MLAKSLKAYKSLFINENFETRLAEKANHCFLKLIKHLFSNLFINVKQLRYFDLIITKNHVIKKLYCSYFKTIHENIDRLLKKTKNTLEESKDSKISFIINSLI